MKIAPLIFSLLQGISLNVYGFVNPDLFNCSTITSYYFLLIVLMAFIFYGITSFRDVKNNQSKPGYLKPGNLQNTEHSHQVIQKKKNFQFQALPSNARTYPIIEPQEHNTENEQQQILILAREMQCEASIDENQLPVFDMNQIPSFTKTPDKQSSPVKDKQSQSSHKNDGHHQPSTQAFSISSTCNEQDAIVKIQEKSKKQSEEKRKSIKKDSSPGLVLQVQVPSIQNEIISEQYSPGMSHRNNMSQSTRAINKLYIEKRYCQICQIDQLVRAKHCNTCNKCVACFDHHCPWSGNCIGERNKCVFYWFLMFQIQELYFVIISTLIIYDFDNRDVTLNALVVIIIIISIFFALLVTSLVIFHTLFMFQNLTTWEFHSWNKISYLKEMPRNGGSPFSFGWKQNLRMFCRFNIQQLRVWEYNPKIFK